MTNNHTEPMKVGEQIPTADDALEALDAMDDYARMDIGVDAIGPREVLRAFIQSHNGQASPSPAEVNDFDATPAFYIDELTANTIKHTALINGKVRFSNKPTAECTIPVYWSALNQRLAVKEREAEPCCNEPSICGRACVFRGEWLARNDPDFAHPVSDDQQAKDAARFEFWFSEDRPTTDEFARLMIQQISGEYPTLDEWRIAIDAALSTTKQEEV